MLFNADLEKDPFWKTNLLAQLSEVESTIDILEASIKNYEKMVGSK